MRSTLSDQRRLFRASPAWAWLLLVVALLTYPDTVSSGDQRLRTGDSLSALAIDSDFTANRAPKTDASEHLPAQVTAAGPPSLCWFPEPETCPVSPLTEAAHLPPSALLRSSVLPRPPPVL